MKKIIVAGLILVGIFFLLLQQGGNAMLDKEHIAAILPEDTLIVYVQDGCSHCHEARSFIATEVRSNYPDLKVEYRDARKEQYHNQLVVLVKFYRLNPHKVGTPVIFGGGKVMTGWGKGSEKKLLDIVKTITAKKS